MRSTTAIGVGKSGANVSGLVNFCACSSEIGTRKEETRRKARIGLLGRRCNLPSRFQFYYTGHNITPRGPKVSRTADGVLVATKFLHSIADGIAPGIPLRFQVIV